MCVNCLFVDLSVCCYNYDEIAHIYEMGEL